MSSAPDDSESEGSASTIKALLTRATSLFQSKIMTRHFSRSAIVTVLVGQQQVECGIHKSLLCMNSRYFEVCLSNDKYANVSDRVELPYDDLLVFEQFVDWLYTSQYDVSNFDNSLKDYQFATERLAEAYANAIMDAIRAFSKEYRQYVTLQGIANIYGNGLGFTQLATFARRSYIENFVGECQSRHEDTCMCKLVALLEEITKNKDQFEDDSMMKVVYFDLADELWSFGKNRWAALDTLSGCQFHNHTDGEICAAAVK